MNVKRIGDAQTILSNPLSRHNYFGWPTVARLQDGMLAVVCSGYRCGHICPFGKAVLMLSADEGKTYTGAWPVIDTPLDDRDGGILAFGDAGVMVTSFNNTREAQRGWNGFPPELDEKRKLRNKYYHAYLDTVTDAEEAAFLGSTFRVSFDGGKTFGPLRRSPVTSPHGPALLSDGTILWAGRTFSANDRFSEGDRVEAWRVDPGSGEMTFVGAVPAVEKNGVKIDACEPHAIQLEDGSLLCHFRGEGSGFFTTFQTVSRDLGGTWTAPERLLPDRGGAPAHLYEHSSGVLISAYGYREGPRYGVRAMLSADNGKSWEKDRILWETDVSGDLGYPATVELEDGTLLTVFYAKDEANGPAVIKQQRWEITA